MTTVEVTTHFVLVSIEDTADWQPDFLASRHITHTYTHYLVDLHQHVQVCELTPSYFLYYVGEHCEFSARAYELELAEQWREEFECQSQLVSESHYMHVGDFDRLLKQLGRLPQRIHDFGLETVVVAAETTDQAYAQVLDAMLEHVQVNSYV